MVAYAGSKLFRKVFVVAAVLGAVGVLAACGSKSDESATSTSASAPTRSIVTIAPGDKLTVVATTSQLADFVRVLGDENVDLTQLVAANVDAHGFEPTSADVEAIGEADVIVRNGVGLDNYLEDAIAASGSKAVVVDASVGVKLLKSGDVEAGTTTSSTAVVTTIPVDGEYDPHIWFNPLNAIVMCRNIYEAFSGIDAANSATYLTRFTSYEAQLTTLDQGIKAQIDALPNKKMVTNHDAFGYYIDHFGLEYVGAVIPSNDTSAEVTASEMRDLVTLIKNQGVKAIFAEQAVSTATADSLARDADAAGVKVVGGENALYGDSLGDAESTGANYLDMMSHNTSVIVENLK